jgi:predicted  nucleic acid-binding Zn-ribbon protein
MTKKRLMPALMTVALSVGGLGACGGGSGQSSATAQVCSDRANLQKAVDGVVTDLKNLNLGKAKDGLSSVNDAFDQLKKSASQLKSEEAKALAPQIDALKSDLQDLKNVRSLSDLEAGWSKVTTQFQAISSQISDTLKCPS